ncbi:MAG: TetR/AcrR family transcriptional regulator [Bacteroidota bacterium]
MNLNSSDITTQQATESKDRIVGSVTDLFYRFGVKSITMDDVARHLAISKKTLYRYFADKNDMVYHCCFHDLEKRKAAFAMISAKALDAVQELVLMMENMQTMLSSINPNLLFDVRKYHQQAWQCYVDFKEQFMMQSISNNLKRGMEAGIYRDDLNVRVLARLRLEEVEMGFNPDIYPPSKFQLKDVQLALFDHFMHGITTPKGQKLIQRYKNQEDGKEQL